MDWSDDDRVCSSYSRYVTESGISLGTVNIDDITTCDEGCSVVETMCDIDFGIMDVLCATLLSEKQKKKKTRINRFRQNTW